MGQRRARRFFHRLERKRRDGRRRCCCDGVIEQDGVLGDDGDLGAQRGDGQVADVVSVDEQPPAGDIEEARQQMDQRGLAGAAGADDGDHLARADLQIDVVQNLALVVFLPVAEMNMLEADALMEWRQLDARPAFRGLRPGVEEVEDRSRKRPGPAGSCY